ncbi:MAG TPA: hypothetical protein DD490_31640 [Acidobacteria bacterium]|nr:hypothetical protein [Acidobacteriota bacterium]
MRPASVSDQHDSEIPQGIPYRRARSRWPATAVRQLRARGVPSGVAARRVGIRNSNIVPLHDSRVIAPPSRAKGRPRWSQWAGGASPLPRAIRLARRASEASRS